jgi:hypothetical protein
MIVKLQIVFSYPGCMRLGKLQVIRQVGVALGIRLNSVNCFPVSNGRRRNAAVLVMVLVEKSVDVFKCELRNLGKERKSLLVKSVHYHSCRRSGARLTECRVNGWVKLPSPTTSAFAVYKVIPEYYLNIYVVENGE